MKIPKWAFEKFPASDPTLGTQMKSVGEAMAIGRTFKEAFQKGLRSLETRSAYRVPDDMDDDGTEAKADYSFRRARLFRHCTRFAHGYHIEELHELTQHRPVVSDNLREIIEIEQRARARADRDDLARELCEGKARGLLRPAARRAYGD